MTMTICSRDYNETVRSMSYQAILLVVKSPKKLLSVNNISLIEIRSKFNQVFNERFSRGLCSSTCCCMLLRNMRGSPHLIRADACDDITVEHRATGKQCLSSSDRDDIQVPFCTIKPLV